MADPGGASVAEPTVVEVIAAVVNTSPVKAVYQRAWDIAWAVEAELRARGLLVEPPPTPETGESRGCGEQHPEGAVVHNRANCWLRKPTLAATAPTAGPVSPVADPGGTESGDGGFRHGDFAEPRPHGNVHIIQTVTGPTAVMSCGKTWWHTRLRPGNGDWPNQCAACWETF